MRCLDARRALAPILAAALAGCGPATGAGAGTGGSSSGGSSGGASGTGAAGLGVPVAGHPGWQERAVLALTNAVRLAPADWKARWAAGDLGAALGAAYPAVGPLRWDDGLGRAARAHSADMASAGCFQHDACDGTAWAARIRASYGLAGAIGENIAAGYPDPDAVVFGWICDGESGACAADGSGQDGHRRNLLAAGFRALGVGWASGGVYRQYWTQDFGGATAAPATPLVDAAHLLRTAGKTTFFANVDAGAAPTSVTVVVDGAEHALQLALGQPARGTWSVDLPRAGACRAYQVVLVDEAGATWRYPAAGRLRTYGEGGCAEDYGD